MRQLKKKFQKKQPKLIKIDLLTWGELTRQLNFNLSTGVFIRKITKAPSVKVGDVAGYKDSKGYIIIRINSKRYKAHILAWLYVYGYIPEKEIDHKDRIKHHNWINNLQESSRQFNAQNRNNPITNTSGVKGVVWSKTDRKWIARLKLNNLIKSLGNYKDFDDAVCARLAGEQCVEWAGCYNNSPAYLYVKKNIQKKFKVKNNKKKGKWCEYYIGRLPYPIECKINKEQPISEYFKNGKRTTIRKTPLCKTCKRDISWRSWKDGLWEKIKYAISQGEDLTDMKSPEMGDYDK